MRIALDATYSVGNDLSGVGVYCQEMIAGLSGAYPETDWLCCYRPHRYLRSLRSGLPPGCRRRLLREPLVPRAELFHGLNQRLPRAPLRRAVSTFHDLFVLTGEYSSPEFRRRFEEQARDAARRSDLIVTVSEFTASQVETLLGVERRRLRVIPHGVRFPVGQAEEQPREKMVLHVGAIQQRKNVARLIQAFRALGPEWRLVLAGSFGFGASAILEAAQDARIQVLGYVGNDQLAALYRRASIFAFPSLDEGFGMPVLEAMAWGVPVLTSNRSALPEVAGDAALLVDPLETEAIAEGLRRLAREEGLRLELAARGRRRAASFTWRSAVEKTRAVYQTLLG